MNRFNAKIVGLIALLGVLCVSALGIGLVKAAQALPKGGDAFGTAVTIEPGSYLTDREIAQDSYEYFKISVKAGQVLTLKFTTPAGGDPYAGGAVYNSLQEKVESEMIIGSAGASKTIIWAASAADAGTFYITVGSDYDVNATGVAYVISLDDHFDAGSQTDAGNTFETAMVLTAPGEYQGYLATEYLGTDLVDIYKLRVGKGAMVVVTVTPKAVDTRFEVTIYDSNQEELASKSSANKGAIVVVSLTEALTKTADLYFKVDSKYWTTAEPISYTLKISTTGGETVDNGEPGAEPGVAGPPTDGEAAKGPNWTLIGGGILALVVVAAAAVLLLKKKQPSQPTQPPQVG